MSTSAPASLRFSIQPRQISELSNSNRANPNIVNPIPSGDDPEPESGRPTEPESGRPTEPETGSEGQRRGDSSPGTSEETPPATPRGDRGRENAPGGGNAVDSGDSGSDGSNDDTGSNSLFHNPRELSEEEQKRLRELKRVDREVRSHERAHLTAAGPHAQGGIDFEFVRGPDGQRYAVGGSVELDTSESSNPDETIKKMKQVRAAALAPPEPSPQDQRIAQKASRNLQEARMKQSREGEGKGGSNPLSAGLAPSETGPGERESSPAGPSTDQRLGGAEASVAPGRTEPVEPGRRRKIQQFFLTRPGGAQPSDSVEVASPGSRLNLLI